MYIERERYRCVYIYIYIYTQTHVSTLYRITSYDIMYTILYVMI